MLIKPHKHIDVFFLIVLSLSCQSDKDKSDRLQSEDNIAVANQEHYKELHRPQYHYTSKVNWFNDPNGLIFHKGLYHMYYQYNPKGTQWGNMSWGHATSKDLIHWKEHEVAIHMTEHMIFSGTTAIDTNNDSGLCNSKDCMIAAYTSFEYELDADNNIQNIAQHQSLAVSHNDGYSFEHYKGNPVLDIRSKEFRDPKIIKHGTHWIMLVSLADQHQIAFYNSKDLKHWTEVSRFGPLGDTQSVWECPDLFPLKIGDTTKWVLTLSAGHPQGHGFYAMQYFIGAFDGETFIPDPLNYPRYLDYGKDFYAGITFAHTNTEDYVTMMAWLGCHVYTKDTPTTNWRGAMSLPRALRLKYIDDELHLVGNVPKKAMDHLIDQTWNEDDVIVEGQFKIPLDSKAFIAEFEIHKSTVKAGIDVLSNGERHTKIGYDPHSNSVFIDRRHSGTTDFNEAFPSVETAPVHSESDTTSLKIYVDHSIVEVFVNDGETMITDRVFPIDNANEIVLFSEGKATVFKNIAIKTLKSIW
ncbi:MAG: glycoside hydrolase family 32 protein [Bacteroidota bacterium]